MKNKLKSLSHFFNAKKLSVIDLMLEFQANFLKDMILYKSQMTTFVFVYNHKNIAV